MTKYYTTKWATTRGIIEFEGEEYRLDGTLYFTESISKPGHLFLRAGVDAFADLDAAKADALARARKNVQQKDRAMVEAICVLDQYERGDIPVVKR